MLQVAYAGLLLLLLLKIKDLDISIFLSDTYGTRESSELAVKSLLSRRMLPLLDGVKNVTKLATRVTSLGITDLPFEKLTTLDIDMVHSWQGSHWYWCNFDFEEHRLLETKYPAQSTLIIRSHACGLQKFYTNDLRRLIRALGCTKLKRFELSLVKSHTARQVEDPIGNDGNDSFDYLTIDMRILAELLEELKIDFKRHDGQQLSYDSSVDLQDVGHAQTLLSFTKLRKLEILQEVLCDAQFPITEVHTEDFFPQSLNDLTIIGANASILYCLEDIRSQKEKSGFPDLKRITLERWVWREANPRYLEGWAESIWGLRAGDFHESDWFSNNLFPRLKVAGVELEFRQVVYDHISEAEEERKIPFSDDWYF